MSFYWGDCDGGGVMTGMAIAGVEQVLEPVPQEISGILARPEGSQAPSVNLQTQRDQYNIVNIRP